jgi:hypothetical protein
VHYSIHHRTPFKEDIAELRYRKSTFGRRRHGTETLEIFSVESRSHKVQHYEQLREFWNTHSTPFKSDICCDSKKMARRIGTRLRSAQTYLRVYLLVLWAVACIGFADSFGIPSNKCRPTRFPSISEGCALHSLPDDKIHDDAEAVPKKSLMELLLPSEKCKVNQMSGTDLGKPVLPCLQPYILHKTKRSLISMNLSNNRYLSVHRGCCL